ncbi:hypothetical protein [Delftia tsuruhatensis]|uniref:hypothetical protein n=1 Tax=Delftia tsuruhatensis TaxID=180282 RepID=UPI0020277A22|nr:hypothetical protein [Delftia tsuruhatensis]
MATDILDERKPGIGLDEAADTINQSVIQFTSELMSRMTAVLSPSSPRTSRGASDLDVMSAKLSTCIAELQNAAAELTPSARSLWFLQHEGEFRKLVGLIEELHTSYFEAEQIFLSSSREVRRSQKLNFDGFKKGYDASEMVKQRMLEFLDYMDPVSDTDIQQELLIRYGDRAPEVIDAFADISNSEHHSLASFKKRHNIR